MTPQQVFSGKPTGTGWDPARIARAWTVLMKRLGYARYVAQGGDWGTPISSEMARQAPAGISSEPLSRAAAPCSLRFSAMREPRSAATALTTALWWPYGGRKYGAASTP